MSDLRTGKPDEKTEKSDLETALPQCHRPLPLRCRPLLPENGRQRQFQRPGLCNRLRAHQCVVGRQAQHPQSQDSATASRERLTGCLRKTQRRYSVGLEQPQRSLRPNRNRPRLVGLGRGEPTNAAHLPPCRHHHPHRPPRCRHPLHPILLRPNRCLRHLPNPHCRISAQNVGPVNPSYCKHNVPHATRGRAVYCISAELKIFAQGPAHNSNIIANFADTQIP